MDRDADGGASSQASEREQRGTSTLIRPWASLFALLGLSGFAISQPLLAVAGEDPTLFIFDGVEGWGIVAFALIVAFVPPLVLWIVVQAVAAVDRRAGGVAFVGIAAGLAGTTVIQWVKTAGGVDAGWLLAIAGILAAVGFGVALVRSPAVGLWTRYSAVLPPVAVVLLLVASPAGELLRSQTAQTAADGRAGVKTSVVFVMLDELPTRTLLDASGGIDPVRFPNLASLASDGTWYRDYTVLANQTFRSVPSILSGTVPEGATPIWTAHPDNLFSLLAPTHELNVIEPVTRMCGFTTCEIDGVAGTERGGVRSLLSQMVDVWKDRVALRAIPEVDVEQFAAAAESAERPKGRAEEKAAAGPADVANFVGSLRSDPSSRPSLSYLHLLLPHQPWTRYPDGRPMKGASTLDMRIDEIEVTDWDLALLEQAHIFQAMWADHLVGRVLDALRAKGTYDETLVVVTADHGLGFEADRFPNLRTTDPEALGEVAFVPLLVKSPGQREGRVDDSNLTALDVLPTIADEVGVDLPWDVEGFAAGSAGVDERGERKVFVDREGLLGGEVDALVDFDASERRPSVSGRRVTPARADEHSLGGLLRPLGGDRWLGVDVEDLTVTGGGRGVVTMKDVEAIQTDDEDSWKARLRGTAEGLAPGETVLLVLDGVVQSASPVLDDGRVGFFVPPEVRGRAGLEASLLVVTDAGYAPVTLTT